MALATLTTISPSVVYAFDGANFQDGHPDQDLAGIPQIIQSMGVDGTRLRRNRRDFKPFQTSLMKGVSIFDDAVTLARSLRAIRSLVCTFVHTAAGTLYTPTTTFYIVEASAAPRAGSFLGGDISPAGAYVEASFVLLATGVAP